MNNPRESPLKELSRKLTLEDFPARGRGKYRLLKGLQSKHNVGGYPLLTQSIKQSNISPYILYSFICTPHGVMEKTVGWFKKSPFSTQPVFRGG